MIDDEHGEWRLSDRPERIPATLTITVVERIARRRLRE